MKNSVISVLLVFPSFLISLFAFSISDIHAATIGVPPPFIPNMGLSSNLVGWWTFDGKNMTPNVRDTSEQGNHGNLFGQTSTTTVQGKIGQALKFDGVNDYVRAQSSSLVVNTGSASLWFKAGPQSNINMLISHGINANDFYAIRYNSGGILFYNYIANSNIFTIDSDSSNLFNNVWHHVVATWDSSNAYLYVDGIRQADSFTGNATMSMVSSGTVYLGDYISGSLNLDGSLDDVRIYNKVLSTTEIRQLYNIGAATKQATSPVVTATTSCSTGLSCGLVGYWTMDGKNIVPNVRDSSGSGNHGNLSGFTSTTTVPGKVGQGLRFDGVDDMVLADQSSITNYPFTLAVWAKTSSTAQIQALSYANSASNVIYYSIGLQANRAHLMVRTSAPEEDAIVGDTVFGSGEWVHIVGVFNSTTDKRIYVNGVQEALLSTSLSFAAGDRIGVGVGARSSLFGFWDGSLDDARIYNRALSTTEIRQLYNIGVASKQSTSPTVTSTACTSGLSCGLVGYWTFDGKNMVPNVRDTSGQGNHGNLIGQTATTTVVGKVGQGLKFDGVDDYVEVGDPSVINVGTGDFSVSAWIYARNDTNFLSPVSFADDALSGGWTLNHLPSLSRIDFQILNNNARAQAALTNDSWHHIVGIRSGSTISIYVDGVKGIDETSSSDINAATSLKFGNQWDGAVDDVRIYNRALTVGEVNQLYNMGR